MIFSASCHTLYNVRNAREEQTQLDLTEVTLSITDTIRGVGRSENPGVPVVI